MTFNLLQEELLTLAITRCPFLSDGAKVTFLCLLSLRVNEIAVREVAMMRGKDDSTVDSHFRELKKHDFISVVGKGGEKKSVCIYEFRLINVFKCMGFDSDVGNAVLNRESDAIDYVFSCLRSPDYLFDLSEKCHKDNIELPNTNANTRFLNRLPKEYKRTDIVKYYRNAYKKRVGVPHRLANRHDLVLCSLLLEKCSSKYLCKIIDHSLLANGDLTAMTFDVFCRNVDRFSRQLSKHSKNSSPNCTSKKQSER